MRPSARSLGKKGGKSVGNHGLVKANGQTHTVQDAEQESDLRA